MPDMVNASGALCAGLENAEPAGQGAHWQRVAGLSGSYCGCLGEVRTALILGMDVPAANCMIRLDPMLNSVSFVQGQARAR